MKFQFAEHPWISIVVLCILMVLTTILTRIIIIQLNVTPITSVIITFGVYTLLFFIIIPFGLHLPKGKKPFQGYLEDIRLSKFQPLMQNLFLTFSCYLILMASQISPGSLNLPLALIGKLKTTLLYNVFNY